MYVEYYKRLLWCYLSMIDIEMFQYIHILVLFLFLQMLVDTNIGINPRMVDLSLKINSHTLYYTYDI